MSKSSIWAIDWTLSEWNWDWWQWNGTLYSPKLQYYWNLTIKLFNVIPETLVAGDVLPLCRHAVGVFYSPGQMGWLVIYRSNMDLSKHTGHLNKRIIWLRLCWIFTMLKNCNLKFVISSIPTESTHFSLKNYAKTKDVLAFWFTDSFSWKLY